MAEWPGDQVVKSKTRLLNLGFDNSVMAERVVTLTAAEPKPIKRLINEARRSNKIIDATNGRKTRSVIVTDSDHVILSSSEPKTLAQRINGAQAS